MHDKLSAPAPLCVTITIEQVVNEYAFIVDTVGNVRGLVDALSGQIREAFVYSPFGTRTNAIYFDEVGAESATSGLVSSFGFAGGITDPDTGMVWLQNRWYIPELGRWNRQDPSLFISGQWNVYTYSTTTP